jgi:excisionase family DNA binding protein
MLWYMKEHNGTIEASTTNGFRTVAEVGRTLRMKRVAVMRLVRRGAFPSATRPGRNWLIPASDVDAYLAARRVKPEVAKGGGAC